MSIRPLGMAVLRALGGGCVLLLGASAVTFLAVEVLPGDPATQALGMNADPERVAALRAELGLDRPVPERYLEWLAGLVRGDLGTSAITGQAVGPIVAEHAARSLVLGGCALALVLCVAIPAGVVAGSRPGSPPDRAASLGAVVLLSVPEFVLAAVLVAVFAHGLGWLPPVSLVGGGLDVLREPEKLVLPAVTLAAVAGAFVLRLTRAATAEAATSAHVESARIAGIPEIRVLCRHLVPSVRAPVAQAVALAVPYLVGGALLVETAFGYPGLAALVAEGLARRDAVLVGGAAMVLATTAVVGFFAAELVARPPRRRPGGVAVASGAGARR
ncbi:ABC transporter permease [Lipingzhangella sp. LS1_29]|uniref:ABC transporter permease n=1 Tax=Lipingzhangella rawalii TaxID=2055835 RepID=A0ABU2HC61_9ACTN|nr:ABC transporter permease [Lipingzhangella rawalii]MDS1272390.1 ABC transporter permease [Lipingzhangella rawalii]